MLNLSTWTWLVDFVALAASLWLGIYIVTRSPRSLVSWLAGLALWSLSGYFLDSFLHLHPPQERFLHWWTGWSVLFSAPLWLHLSTMLRRPSGGWQRVPVYLAYATSLVLLVMEVRAGTVFGVALGKPFVLASAQRPGPLYPVLCLLLTVSPFLAMLNLHSARQQSRRPALRRQLGILMLATLFSTVAGAYLTLSVWFELDVPILFGQAALALALVLLGYGVARYSALMEGRATRADFTYSLLAIAVVVGLYLTVTYISYLVFGISFAVFIFVLVLVILTHSLYEWGGNALERLLYRRRYRDLRANLRALAREAEGHDLVSRLAIMLRTSCRSLDCRWGWIALREGDGFNVVVSHPPDHALSLLGKTHITADESLSALDSLLKAVPSAGTATYEPMLVPLTAQGSQVGAIVLGEKTNGVAQGYSEEELDVLETLAGQVANLVHAVRQQDEAARQIDALIGEFRRRELALRQELGSALAGEAGAVEQDPSEMRRSVEDALRHLYDYTYLGEHELAQLSVVDRRLATQERVITTLDRGRALGQILAEVIERLRPPGTQPRTLTREWVQYTILHSAYVLGEPNRDIMSQLYISESSFNRARRRAVRGVARAIQEIEKAAPAESDTC